MIILPRQHHLFIDVYTYRYLAGYAIKHLISSETPNRLKSTIRLDVSRQV